MLLPSPSPSKPLTPYTLPSAALIVLEADIHTILESNYYGTLKVLELCRWEDRNTAMMMGEGSYHPVAMVDGSYHPVTMV